MEAEEAADCSGPRGRQSTGSEQHFRRSVVAISQALQEVAEVARSAASTLAEGPCDATADVSRTAGAILASIYARYAILEAVADGGALEAEGAGGWADAKAEGAGDWADAKAPRAPRLPASSGKALMPVPPSPGSPGRSRPLRRAVLAAMAFVPPRRQAAGARAARHAVHRGADAHVIKGEEESHPMRSSATLEVRKSVVLALEAMQGALTAMEGSAAESVMPLPSPEQPTPSTGPCSPRALMPEEESDPDEEDRDETLPPGRLARFETPHLNRSGSLFALRRCFDACDPHGHGCLSPASIARSWASGVQRTTGRPLEAQERALVAADVQRFFERVDVTHRGEVCIEDWLHYALLEAHPPGPANLEIIMGRLHGLHGRDTIRDTVHAWESADGSCTGLVARGDLLSVLEQTEHRLPDRLGADPNSQLVSYAEFCAYKLGLDFESLELLYYDLSKHVAKYLSPVLLWRMEEGIWHTSLVVYGKEYFYFGQVSRSSPCETPFGKPTKSLKIGATLRKMPEFHAHLARELNAKFDYDSYDVFKNNCNHCSDAMLYFLLGRHVPDQVRFLPDRVMGTPVAKMLRPVLNTWLRGVQKEAEEDGDEDGPRKPVMKRGKVLEDVSEELHRGAGGMVLFEAPGTSAPIIAQVTRARDDGTSDIEWLDSSGRHRVQKRVRSDELRPYRAAGTDTAAWTRTVYLEAFEALYGEGAEAEVTRCAADADAQAGLILREFVSAPVKVCPKSHELVQERYGFRAGFLRRRKCDECGRKIPHGERRMGCARGCHYAVCQDCWESGSSSLRAILHGCSQGKCPRGHSLEQLFGQGLRGEATCKICKRRELGAALPFFLSCRLCSYDVCPRCISNLVEEQRRT